MEYTEDPPKQRGQDMRLYRCKSPGPKRAVPLPTMELSQFLIRHYFCNRLISFSFSADCFSRPLIVFEHSTARLSLSASMRSTYASSCVARSISISCHLEGNRLPNRIPTSFRDVADLPVPVPADVYSTSLHILHLNAIRVDAYLNRFDGPYGL